MPAAVLERPVIDPKLQDNVNKPAPRWYVRIFRDDKKTNEELSGLLVKCFRGAITDTQAKKFIDICQREGGVVIWRGLKEPGEAYSELLLENEVRHVFEPEN